MMHQSDAQHGGFIDVFQGLLYTLGVLEFDILGLNNSSNVAHLK